MFSGNAAKGCVGCAAAKMVDDVKPRYPYALAEECLGDIEVAYDERHLLKAAPD